ncbi:MAG: carbamoyltransferase family protein [Solirubrobacteraceae bacterium]
MRVLGINAVFHDPAAALVVDGEVVAAAEEERFSRRKHGKPAVPFAAWELPEQAARWCLEHAGIDPSQLDAVAYSYDPALARGAMARNGAAHVAGEGAAHGVADGAARDGAAHGVAEWEALRTLYAERAPLFLKTALPGLDPGLVEFVPHHVAHAASAYLASPCSSSAVLVLDGRGETASMLAGHARGAELEVLSTQALPHSLGLLYEELTAHLGFARGSDEYKVMALASYGRPTSLSRLRELVRCREGRIEIDPFDWRRFASKVGSGSPLRGEHADLAASVQRRLEEAMLELASWLHARTGETSLTMAGGVALNCVANSRLWRESPFERVWVQPAAGDSGTALGAALHVAASLGDQVSPMRTAALGREWDEQELARRLQAAGILYERPANLAETVADALTANAVVAWFQGRSEFGPRALGQRSLLADPRRAGNAERLNEIKGREQFRPIAPIVLAERAGEIFRGPLPSPYMLFTHTIAPEWRKRLPAVMHVDGSSRVQTVDRREQPLLAEVLDCFERRTGVPALVNTSFNTAGRPIVDDPRDALECLGSAPIDMLAIGPFVVRRLVAPAPEPEAETTGYGALAR